MQQNNNFNIQDAMRLANSPEGQQLIALLKQSDDGTLQSAMEQAKKGDYSRAKEALTPLLASEEIQKLLRQMGG